jgi:hypothetical protein
MFRMGFPRPESIGQKAQMLGGRGRKSAGRQGGMYAQWLISGRRSCPLALDPARSPLTPPAHPRGRCLTGLLPENRAPLVLARCADMTSAAEQMPCGWLYLEGQVWLRIDVRALACGACTGHRAAATDTRGT